MIAVDRNRVHEDTGEPIRPAKEWFERAKAAQHTVRPAEFNEGLYGDPEVRASLLETNKVPPDSIARQALLSHCQRDDQPYAAFMRCMVADLGLA